MTRTAIVPATDLHALELAPRLRLADVQEIWAASRATPHRALLASLRRSGGAWAGMADGRVVCMFGVAPVNLLGDTGVPWLLGSDDIERHAVTFLRGSKRYIAEMSRDYRLLTNYVDARNTLSIRWLKWLRFDILAAEPYGPFGLPFHRFEMKGAA